MEIIDEDKYMKQCPRFDSCSAPLCPLDYFEDLRLKLPGEEKCKVAKSIRMKIAKDSILPRKGMTKQEFAAWRAYQKKSPKEKEALIDRGKRALKSFKEKLIR